jgi:hypothetical protein
VYTSSARCALDSLPLSLLHTRVPYTLDRPTLAQSGTPTDAVHRGRGYTGVVTVFLSYVVQWYSPVLALFATPTRSDAVMHIK